MILGPPGSGKAGRAIDALRDAAARGVDAFLLVPGAVDRARFLRELAGRDDEVLVGIEVGTFDQLVARIAGSPPVRRTDRAMERILVRDALADVPAFDRAAAWSGFVDTARAHVDELRRARVWGGEELLRVEAELPGEHVDAWRRLEQRVGELLDERRLRDDAWFERQAERALRRGAPGVDAVVCYGFDSFAPGRLALLERLAGHVPVTVTLAWRPGRRVHERAADLRDRWRTAGAFVEELDAQPDVEPVLAWLGSELFEDTSSTAPETDRNPDTPAAVAFVDCCGPTQEADEVVREVALLRARGMEWDDIVVASADAATGSELLLAAFERAGMPARLQARRRAVDVPAGRALHELLDAIVERDELRLVGALQTPLFGVDRERVDDVELRLRRGRHGARRWLDDPRLVRLLPGPISELARHAAASGPADGDVVRLRAMLASLHPADLGELDLLRGVAALLEGLVVAAGGDRGIGVRDLRDALAALVLATPDRSDSGTVVIASLDDLRSIAWDAVVLRGMHLAAFRARVDHESDAPAAGRDLLHLAVTRARRTLRVVRQAAGSDGGHLAPSPGWQELRRLLLDAPLRTRRLGEVVVEPARVLIAAERPIAAARAIGDGIDLAGIDEELRETLHQARRRPREQQLRGTVAQAIVERPTISVTELEQYSICSAKWYIERRLRASDPDDDRSRIVDGLVAHRLLQSLVPQVRTGELPPIDELRTLARALVPTVLDEVDGAAVLHPSRIDRIVEHVVTLVDAERDWPVPDLVETEREFGTEATDAVAAGLRIDDVELVGRIDRIDHHGSEVVLHDYKYGSSDRPASKLIADRHLQLLVYWLALRQPGSPVEPIGALYRAVTGAGAPSGAITHELRDRGYVAKGKRTLSPDATDELLDSALELVRDTVRDLRAGIVRPLDDPADCPTYCRLQSICRIGEGHAP